jgi:ABC-type sugar transport system ATPase subunit
MIIADKIVKSYSGKRILNEISLELKRGEISVLFGPSGCGKTTLCRNLTLLEYPDSGTVKIDNSIYKFPTKNRFSTMPYPRVNMVFQQLFLWPHLTNEENIKLSIDNFSKEKKEKFDYLTKLLEIRDITKQYPNESSLGQKQRVAIARVLILKEKTLLCRD